MPKHIPEPNIRPIRCTLRVDQPGLVHRFNLHYPDPDDPERAQMCQLKCYLTLGVYPSGRLGSVIIHVDREGSFTHGALNAYMMSLSLGLQCGIPLAEYTRQLRSMKFSPAGIVPSAPDGVFPEAAGRGVVAKRVHSVLDYIGRYLDWRFPEGYLRQEEERPCPCPPSPKTRSSSGSS